MKLLERGDDHEAKKYLAITKDINNVFKRMEKKDIMYRCVIDMSTLDNEQSWHQKNLGTIGH